MRKLQATVVLTLLSTAGCYTHWDHIREVNEAEKVRQESEVRWANQARELELQQSLEPTIVTRAEWNSTPQPFPDDYKHTPKIITIHHAGVLWKPGTDPAKSIKNLQTWGQKEKNWRDVPYHFQIAPDGRVFEGRELQYKPDTNTKYELSGVLNIELWGNFEEQRVSPEQLRALVLLIAKLAREHQLDLSLIRGHGDAAVGQTVCPGKDFKRYLDQGLIRRWAEQALAGQMPPIQILPELPGGPTTQISTAPPTAPPTAPATQPSR